MPLLIHAAKLFQNKIITKFLFLNYKSILDIFFRLNMKQIKFISCVLWLSHSYVNYGGFWIMHQLLQNIICILERTWNIGGGEISKVVTKSLSGKCLILPLNIRRGGKSKNIHLKKLFVHLHPLWWMIAIYFLLTLNCISLINLICLTSNELSELFIYDENSRSLVSRLEQ